LNGTEKFLIIRFKMITGGSVQLGNKFEKLAAIMSHLRGPEGCPWDREQTHASLRQHLLEEAHEVLECIDKGRFDDLRGELGDLLLQVVFHAQMASEANRFAIEDVVDAISDKLIRRHPHVFGDARVESAQEQVHLWERIKKEEGKQSALDGVPRALPALQRASRLQQKARSAGFRWRDEKEVWEKFDEEMKELSAARETGDSQTIEDEFGDVLFVMAQLAQYAGVNPEDALRRACEKFIRRFQKMEKHFGEQGRHLHEVSLEEMDEVWQEAKRGSGEERLRPASIEEQGSGAGRA
jgi:MazG family protein